MSSVAAQPRTVQGAPTTRSNAGPVWGMDVRDLHDRYWAARGVSVVRRGSAAVENHGPNLYLLIDPDDVVHFELRELSERLAWLKPAAIRLRIVDNHTEPYSERVIADPDGRFVRMRRAYRARTRMTRRAWLTPDPKLAQIWADAPVDDKPGTRRDALRAVRTAVGQRRTLPSSCAGRIIDTARDDSAAEAASLLFGRWDHPSDAIDGVYEYERGIWVHETAVIGARCRLVAPVWIGAGVTISPDTTLVGPLAIPDEEPVTPEPIDWQELRIPRLAANPTGQTRAGRRLGKRAFDIAFSLAAIIGTAWLYPIVALAIMIEDGRPIFFAHRRQTTRGREFPCWKFRTMCKNADKMKLELQRENVCDGPQFFMENDPRVLRVGRILRKLQIDEFPQFWNVLVGHMSVVGPRPSPDNENQFCPAWREARLSVRPGVTGLWQVRRTREPQTDFQEWIRYDLEYVQRQSWRLDLWVICLTIKNLLIRSGSEEEGTP